MAILTLDDDGNWTLDMPLAPVEFWPYTTYVRDVILSAPRDLFQELHAFLIQEFQKVGIPAYAENKSAFGLKDETGKVWYFGFKDFSFHLGTNIQSDAWNKPLVRPPSAQ